MRKTIKITELEDMLNDVGMELYERDEYDGEDNFIGTKLAIRQKYVKPVIRFMCVKKDGSAFRNPMILAS